MQYCAARPGVSVRVEQHEERQTKLLARTSALGRCCAHGFVSTTERKDSGGGNESWWLEDRQNGRTCSGISLWSSRSPEGSVFTAHSHAPQPQPAPVEVHPPLRRICKNVAGDCSGMRRAPCPRTSGHSPTAPRCCGIPRRTPSTSAKS